MPAKAEMEEGLLRKPANHGAPVVPRKLPFRTANWRSVVFGEIARLEQDLALAPQSPAHAAGRKSVLAAISQAREFAHTKLNFRT